MSVMEETKAQVQAPETRIDLPWKESCTIVLLAFFLSLAFAIPTLARFPETMLAGHDGRNFVNWARQSFAYAGSPIDLSVISPLKGSGGLVQPLGVWLHPAYLPYLIKNNNALSCLITYINILILMFFSSYLLARSLGLRVLAASMAAQAIALFSFPPVSTWYYSRGLNPCHLYTLLCGAGLPVALATLFLALFTKSGQGTRAHSLAMIAAIPLVLVYSATTEPLYTPVFFILIPIVCLGILLASPDRTAFVRRLAGSLFCIAVLALLKFPQYYKYMSETCARWVFPNEIYSEVQRFDYLTSMMFQWPYGVLIALLIMFGGAVVLVYGSRQQKGFALAIMAVQALMAGISLYYVYSGARWSAPSPSYYEHGVWPAYLVLIVLAGSLLVERWMPLRQGRWLRLLPCTLMVPVVGFLLTADLRHPFLHMRYSASAFRHIVLNKSKPPAVRSSGLADYLRGQLAINPGDKFRGATVSLIGVPGGPVARKLGFPDDSPYTKVILARTYDYMGAGFDDPLGMVDLWIQAIPTVEDYNQRLSPFAYYIFSRALSRPRDYQSRNFAIVTFVRPRLLAALGARFLLTDVEQDAPTLERRRSYTNSDGITLSIYELANPNLGNYSPTEVVRVANGAQALACLKDDGFDFEKKAVLVDDIPLPKLEPALGGSLSFERGGVRVRAHSDSTSLLVLPIQFSNSLRMAGAGSEESASRPRLLRVDLLLTGVLFSGELDIKLDNDFGLFRSVAGGKRDIEDCKRLGIVETGEVPYPPDYQPLALRRVRPRAPAP